MDLDIGKKALQYGIIFIVLFFLSMQIQGLGLEPHVSASYVSFYSQLAILGLILVVASVAFAWKYGDILGIPTAWKAVMVSLWVIFIVVISTSAGQILPVPKASAVSLQLNEGTELYTSSFIPGIIEDWTYLWGLPLILLLSMLLFAEYVAGIEISAEIIAILAIVACLIAATGYNIWLVPGFTTAHIPAYGNAQNAYIGAWTFAFGQSMIYVFTGWFLPIAHIIHNYLVTYGNIYQINIGGLSIVGG